MSDREENKSSWHAFRSDLGKASVPWRTATPVVPIITVLIAIVLVAIPILLVYVSSHSCLEHRNCLPGNVTRRVFVSTIGSTISLAIGFLFAGWAGTERMWYLRTFRQKDISANEQWRFTWAFVGRYFRLDLLVTMVSIPASTLIVLWGANQGGRVGFRLAGAVVPLTIGFMLTFVKPALAYSTKRVRTALREGVGMIGAHWPASAWYVLVPPLAIGLFARLAPLRLVPSVLGTDTWGRLVLVAIGALLTLWFNGATDAFYLRVHEVGDDGAAFFGGIKNVELEDGGAASELADS